MMRRHAFALLLLTALSGCSAREGGPAPVGLGYQEPDPNPSTYVFSDSTTLTVAAPGYGPVEVVTSTEGLAELEFRPAPDGFQVQVRFPRLTSRFLDMAGADVHADHDDLGGPIGVALTRTGAVTVVDSPAVSPDLLDITDLEGLVRPLFVQLPERVVQPGDRWVDTLTTEIDEGQTRTVSTTVLTSTLDGDTVAGGRRLLRVRTEAATESRVTGESGGVEVDQRLSGVVRGHVLWDPAAHLLVERVEEGRVEGTLGMPGAGVEAMPVSAVLRRRVMLRP